MWTGCCEQILLFMQSDRFQISDFSWLLVCEQNRQSVLQAAVSLNRVDLVAKTAGLCQSEYKSVWFLLQFFFSFLDRIFLKL